MKARVQYIARYEGTEDTLHDTEADAIKWCNDFTRAESQCVMGSSNWDWIDHPDYDGKLQIWTHPDDDRPMGVTSGEVFRASVIILSRLRRRRVSPNSFAAKVFGAHSRQDRNTP